MDQEFGAVSLGEYAMRVRAMIAMVVALAMAVAPLAAAAATAAPVKASIAAAADCDHYAHRHAPRDKAPAHPEIAICGLCCAALAGVGIVSISHDAGMGAAIEPVRLSGLSLSWLTAPPFRPPRA
jgi:hypothetical protein